MIEMKLRNDPFEKIKNGKKTIEVRLYDDKRKDIKENDIIEFTNIETASKIRVKVIKLHLFDSFEELFNHFSYSCFGYNSRVEFDYRNMYEHYNKEEENKYGVVGIEIKLIKGDE